MTINELYPEHAGFVELKPEKLGKMTNNYLQYVESNWKT